MVWVWREQFTDLEASKSELPQSALQMGTVESEVHDSRFFLRGTHFFESQYYSTNFCMEGITSKFEIQIDRGSS